MRIDRRFNREGLSKRQLFFTECWSNFCHKNSIDTDRVSYSNALSAVRELLFLYGMEDRFQADKKRSRVAGELIDILEQDPVLSSVKFDAIPRQLIELCPRDILSDRTKSQIEKRPRLIQSLCSQLGSLIEQYYVTEALALLDLQLFSPDEMGAAEARAIHGLTNNIMSVLLTQGMTLTECYLLYVNILRNAAEPGAEGFRLSFDSFSQKLVTPMEELTVRMYIFSEKLHDLLNTTGPSLQFNGCLFKPLDDGRNKFVISVDIGIRAMSDTSARNGAEHLLRESLDVIAYMIGKSEIGFQKPFVIVRGDTETQVPRFDNEIEANADRLTADEFARFMVAMNGLFSSASEESRKKISSAFRFFRNGIENTSRESRFTSYWSALESITLGVAPGTPSHDEHVISVVAPCMLLDYMVKQLFALRQVLRYLNKSNAGSITVADVVTVTLAELYLLLKDETKTPQLLAELEAYPYVTFSVQKLIEICCSHEKMEKKLVHHQEKVTKHIHRLYLLRNTIVHNAGTSPHIELLTVNLEHYLRGTINAMFYTATLNPTINTAEEAFTRCQYIAESICRELNPTWGILERKTKESVESDLKAGKITRTDACLLTWLKAHQ
ncbi:hypothetical protein K5Y32_22605 [Pantoea sp. DY-15]|uniref:hypothetical protein n=1 Tax=Pantoea sp. DY-15 TaxID=2871489 RepID=UPI001C96D2FA|nr:hypothetical protein [Pantoea sp. DY-15]MBY4890723.1 hypothetical protein [Pantoea sp. DY-15]